MNGIEDRDLAIHNPLTTLARGDACHDLGSIIQHLYAVEKPFPAGDPFEEVKELKAENMELKQAVAELLLRNRVLKKTSEGLE